MNRLLHFLLALLIAVATFDPAVCSSAFSSGAPHARICLHAHADPINGLDPSGHEFNLVSLSTGSAISQSMSAVYNGSASAAGNAMRATLFGIQAGTGANEILIEFSFDEIGIELGIDAFNAVRGLFSGQGIPGDR